MICHKCQRPMHHTSAGWACFALDCQPKVTYSSGTETSLQKQLEAERERVRVLREALENMVSTAAGCNGWESFPTVAFDAALDALATTEPEDGE